MIAQLAKQAIADQVADMLEPAKQPAKPAAAAAENLGLTIMNQIQAMQKACKEDQELIALCHTGQENIRLVEVYVPSPQLMVLTGFDPNKNLTRIVTPVNATQIVCKIVKVQPGVTPAKIAFVTPKPSP
jgi:hypothetical protein